MNGIMIVPVDDKLFKVVPKIPTAGGRIRRQLRRASGFRPGDRRVVNDAVDLDSGRTGTAPVDGMLLRGKEALVSNVQGIEREGWDIIFDNPENIAGFDMKTLPLASAMWDTLSPRQTVDRIMVSPCSGVCFIQSGYECPCDVCLSNPQRRDRSLTNHRLHRQPLRVRRSLLQLAENSKTEQQTQAAGSTKPQTHSCGSCRVAVAAMPATAAFCAGD